MSGLSTTGRPVRTQESQSVRLSVRPTATRDLKAPPWKDRYPVHVFGSLSFIRSFVYVESHDLLPQSGDMNCNQKVETVQYPDVTFSEPVIMKCGSHQVNHLCLWLFVSTFPSLQWGKNHADEWTQPIETHRTERICLVARTSYQSRFCVFVLTVPVIHSLSFQFT
jgi:hypothetical protein